MLPFGLPPGGQFRGLIRGMQMTMTQSVSLTLRRVRAAWARYAGRGFEDGARYERDCNDAWRHYVGCWKDGVSYSLEPHHMIQCA